MGLDAMRIRVQIRRFLVISTRTSYKSARKHPFIVGMVCFLIFLYRSFPFLFSLLVSVSPVLVCTAVLLGTLLSFGEPNIPEIEKEEEVTHEISSLKAGVLGDATVVVDKDGDFFVESFVGKRKDTAGEAIGEESWEKNRVSKIEEDDSLGDYVPLIDESSREIQFEKQVIDQVEREFDDLELEKKMGIYEEKQGIKEVLSNGEAAQSHYSLVQNVRNETLQVEYDKSSGESIEAEKGDHLDSQHSSWKRANDGGGDDDDEEEEEEDEDASDSGSDGAESFSPDASMADIIPMLDELHPLLNEETPLLHEASPQPDMSRDGFDAGSEQSHESKESSVESEEDIENLADREEDGDDDNDNEEDEGAQGGKEDESKSAIKWTEDDQKNLMDLGTLELERNQRLESLIARRRARRNLRSMAEKNLIDLDGADLPINVPPISTTRRNPFDLPYDSYDDVPGSAPSILLPRHNPFDLPYDSNEEKPDLKGDSFQQEFSSLQHREPFFRRHESFSVGPSVLGGPKQERQDLRWKPYFVPERYATEGTSYATFQRQLSGASESKLSSAPDTESVSSVVEEEDKKLNEDVSQETDMISNLDHASILVERGSLSSEDIDSADIENVERRDVHRDGDEITFGDVENHQELDSRLSTLGGATAVELNTREILLRMEPGEEGYSSGSSLTSLSEVDEKLSDVKNGSMSPEPRNAQIEESHISTHTSDFHFMSEVADENEHREPVLEPRSNHTAESGIVSFDSDFHFTSGVEYENRCMEPVLEPTGSDIGDSSISMQASLNSDSQLLSEVEDNDQKKKPDLEPRRNHIRESGTSTQTSLNSDFHFTSELVDDNQHKEPVYDSSPQPVDKLLSLLSISPDAQGETSEMGSPPASVEFSNEVSEMHTESMGKDDSGYKEMHEDSPDEHSLDENESRLRELTEIDNDVMKVGLSGDDLNLDDQNSKNGLIKPELAVEHDAVDSPVSSSNNGSIKDSLTYLEERSNHELDQLQSAGLNAETIVGLHQDVIGNSDWTSSSNQVASEETILHALEEEHPSVAVDVSADSKLSYLESEAVEEHAVGTEGILQLEQKQVPLSNFDSEIHVNGFQAMHEKLDSVTSSSEHMPSNDLSGSTNEEGQPALVAEQVLEARLDVSSTEIKHVEEHSLRKEETLQFKQDYEHSSSSDAEIGADLLQDADMKLVSSGSSHQHVPSEARSLFELEKQMSWSDTSVVEPSIDDNDESREPSVTLVESTAEVNIAKDVNVPEVFDHETSESISVPPESLEYKSRVDEFDFKDNILDKIVYEESGHVLEHPSYSEETHKSSVSKENINEDEDEIKEIDEGLLSELDTVGDFRVKEVVGELLHDEQMTQKSGVLSPDYDLLPRDLIMAEIKPELPLLEVKSVTDIELAFKQLHEGVNVEEVILPSMIEDQPIADDSKGPGENNSDLRVVEAKSLEDIHVAMKQAAEENIEEMLKPSEINMASSSNSTEELPVLEVRTINDIDLAFKQLNEGMDVEEVILPSAIEQHLAVDESEDPHQSSFDLQARSLEDLHIAMKHASEENIEDMSKPSGLKEGPAEVNEVGSSSSTRELPVLEVRTIDDIDLVFKEPNNGIDVEKLENLVVNESRDPQQSSSDLQVLEASSLEDDHIAMKQVSEVKIEELPKSDPTTENVLRTSEVNEISPAKDINSSTDFTQESGSATVDSGAQETSTMAPHESKHALDEKSGI